MRSYPAELTDFVRLQVAAGFDRPEEIAETAIDIYEANPDEIAELVDEALQRREADSRTWPAETDCERLDRAFAALNASGVLARHHFTCCRNCGHSEIVELVHDAREDGDVVDGYVFYHWQNTEAAIDGSGLHLHYAAMAGEPDADAAIGQRVAAALGAERLEVRWNADPMRTIELPSFDWKRREAPPATEKPSPAWTAESLLARWCADLAPIVGAELADALGDDYGPIAVAVGCADAALEWARAVRVYDPMGRRMRGRALMQIAQAFEQAGIPADRVRALRLEACAAAPYGRNGALIDLLLERGSLADPVVRAALRERVTQARRDQYGATAIAWYLVRTPAASDEDERKRRERILADAARLFEAPGHRAPDPESGLELAFSSASWVLLTRLGQAEGAQKARDAVFEMAGRSEGLLTGKVPFAERAALAAAEEAGELEGLAARLEELDASLLFGTLLDALTRAGQVDRAIDLAHESTDRARLLLRLARRVPGDPRVPAWIEQAEADESKGLLSPSEAQDVNVERAGLYASRGEQVRARIELEAVAHERRRRLTERAAGVLAHLEQVRATGEGPTPPLEQAMRWAQEQTAYESHARNLAALLKLAPAVLALSSDPRACAAAMLKA